MIKLPGTLQANAARKPGRKLSNSVIVTVCAMLQMFAQC